jgi:hypothetical protein
MIIEQMKEGWANPETQEKEFCFYISKKVTTSIYFEWKSVLYSEKDSDREFQYKDEHEN